MSPPNHLHLDPFLSSYPPQSSPSLSFSPPNYQHELIVASDGWHCSRKLPVAHHHPIIVAIEAFLSCRAASSCCPSPLSCRPLPSSCHLIVAVLPMPLSCHVLVPPVAVVVSPVALLRHVVVVLPVVVVPHVIVVVLPLGRGRERVKAREEDGRAKHETAPTTKQGGGKGGIQDRSHTQG